MAACTSAETTTCPCRLVKVAEYLPLDDRATLTAKSGPRMAASPCGVLISYLESDESFETWPRMEPSLRFSTVSVTRLLSPTEPAVVILSMTIVVFAETLNAEDIPLTLIQAKESGPVAIVSPGFNSMFGFNWAATPPGTV